MTQIKARATFPPADDATINVIAYCDYKTSNLYIPLFVFFKAGVVSTVDFFNYEVETFYILTFDVKDQYLNALEKNDLNVTIANVNEAPTLTITATSLAIDENEVWLQLLLIIVIL